MRKRRALWGTLMLGAALAAPLGAADKAPASTPARAPAGAPAPSALGRAAVRPAAVTPAAAVVTTMPIDAEKAAAQRGRAVFQKNCIMCHGDGGKGDGRVAKLYKPPPANLVASTRTDTYKTMIIRKGGAYVGRSLTMPSWEGELTADEISDVVTYLREIAQPGSAGG